MLQLFYCSNQSRRINVCTYDDANASIMYSLEHLLYNVVFDRPGQIRASHMTQCRHQQLVLLPNGRNSLFETRQHGVQLVGRIAAMCIVDPVQFSFGNTQLTSQIAPFVSNLFGYESIDSRPFVFVQLVLSAIVMLISMMLWYASQISVCWFIAI